MSGRPGVLVLDDEPLIVRRLQSVLERRGFEVEGFTDSRAALARLAERAFAVVLTDVKMQGASGLDVARFVRTHAPATRVIVITGYATRELSRQAEAAGAWRFVPKPFRLRELARMVEEAAGVVPAGDDGAS